MGLRERMGGAGDGAPPPPPPPPSPPSPPLLLSARVHGPACTKMATSQGGSAASAGLQVLQVQACPGVPHWPPAGPPLQQPLHTARSLERALDDAVCSGILNISGRKLRDYPGLSFDLTDTTQAGARLSFIPFFYYKAIIYIYIYLILRGAGARARCRFASGACL